MVDISRRGAIANAIIGGAGLALTASTASAQPTAPTGPPAPAVAGGYTPRPLPFDPAAIPGFSARILTSHHDNNYAGAVTRIGAIRGQLAGLDLATAPGFLLNGLKREELMATNSMILHEAYFACIGPAGNAPGAALARRLETDFGSVDRWRTEFVALGKALGGGSGWALLTWSPRAGRLVNQWAADHTMTMADGQVLVALDMYEHAYQMDFGARAGAYVDAYMAVLNWSHADRAFAAAGAV